MKNLGLILALAAVTPASLFVGLDAAAAADTATAAVTPVIGKMLYSADGKKLAAVYKIDSAGAPQLLLEGKLITVPVSTLSEVDGKVETSLTKKDLFTKF